MNLDSQEKKLRTQNTPPLQTPALLIHTLSFMAFIDLPALEKVSKFWKQMLVKIVWNLNLDIYLKRYFFTPDDVKAFTTDKDTDTDIWSTLKELSENKGFASHTDLEALRSTPINLYSVHQRIQKRIREENGLLNHQKAYLRSARVMQAIITNKLTLEKAMGQFNVEAHTRPLSLAPSQLSGLYLGFSYAEVEMNNFNSDHVCCALLGHNLDEVIRLNRDQAKSLRKKLTSDATAEPAKTTHTVCA
jgi:hypothetical protein